MLRPDELEKFGGLIQSVGEELISELFEQWRVTADPDDREAIFFRQMAIDDLVDEVMRRVHKGVKDGTGTNK